MSFTQQVYTFRDSQGPPSGRNPLVWSPGSATASFGFWGNAFAVNPVSQTSEAAEIAQMEGLLGGNKFGFHLSYWNFTALQNIDTDPVTLDDLQVGRVPLIAWGVAGNTGTPNNGFNTFLFDQIAAGTYDNIIDATCDAFRRLTIQYPTAKFVIRPTWEFNLNIDNPASNPNGNNGYDLTSTPTQEEEYLQFVNYFQHLVTRFRINGITNVSWCWCPSGSYKDLNTSPVYTSYPGDGYVDYLGVDAYDKIDASTQISGRGFVNVFTSFMTQYAAYYSNKPILICETGEINASTVNTTLTATVNASPNAAVTLPVVSSAGIAPGQSCLVGAGGSAESCLCTAVPDGTHITVASTQNQHVNGAAVVQDTYTQTKYFTDMNTALQAGGSFANYNIRAVCYFNVNKTTTSGYNWSVNNPTDASGGITEWKTLAGMGFWRGYPS